MVKIPFNVSARTAILIGRENVTHADGAVIELVKNTYDADATEAIILFSSEGELYIIDNGHGMKKEVILNEWMTIGTDSKEKDPYSPEERVKTGAKGIGRFALDRLGKRVEMFTLPRGEKDGYLWSVDWSNFEKTGVAIGDIHANLEVMKDLKLEEKIPYKYLTYFKIKFPSGGTILKISFLRDNWAEEQLQELYRNLETLVPANEEDPFTISVYAAQLKGKFGVVKPLINDVFDCKILASFDNKTKQLEVEIERNEFDLVELKKKFGDVFKDPLMQSFPYNLETFKKGRFSQTLEINNLLPGFKDDKKLLSKIGDFIFEVSFAKNTTPNKEDARRFPYKNADYRSRKAWLKKFGGIKIFRDNFRIRPYGEQGQDWLDLGERHAQSPAGPGQRIGGYKFRPNQLAGSVYISRLQNDNFQDKSSREGIQENEVFNLFREILIGILGLLEKDRNVIFYSLSELCKRTDEAEQQKAEVKEAAERIKNNKYDSSSDDELHSDASKLANALDLYESESEEKDEEIRILRSLASAGLITAAVAHELRGLRNALLTRNEELRDLIKPYIPQKLLKDVKDEFNPYVLLEDMKKADQDLHEWISYALTPLRRDRRSTKQIYLKEYFETLREIWDHLLEERKIELSIENVDKSFSVKTFSMDLDTMFNNLIINSIESFSRSEKTGGRKIQVKCTKEDSDCLIRYSDNGAGLDVIYKKNPTQIFHPQETTKRDNLGRAIGTGMGMYLVKSVVDNNKGRIEIKDVKHGFMLDIFLPIIEA